VNTRSAGNGSRGAICVETNIESLPSPNGQKIK
jgi:hypothetical protein